MNNVVLYDYPKSSASYRVRIALNLAGIAYEKVNIDLLAGAQSQEEHLARNPQGFVPVLEIDGERFTQSLAILEYLDSTRALDLLPKDPVERAKAKALAMIIALDIHPICNTSVAKFATGGEEPARSEWMQHFIMRGLNAFETTLAQYDQSPYSTGSTIALADICLMPQLYNARRWGADYQHCERIKGIEQACSQTEAFQMAHPDL